MLGTILIIVLLLLLLGAWPAWPYSSGWGYYPSGTLGLVLVIVLVLAVYIGLLQLVRVIQKLCGDARNRNVVDIDVLLANQIEQQVERAVVDLANRHGEGRLRSLLLSRGGAPGLGR